MNIEDEIRKVELTKYNYLKDEEKLKNFHNSVMGKISLLNEQINYLDNQTKRKGD